MNLSIMRLVPTEGHDASRPTDPPIYTSQQRLAPHVRRAIVRGRRWLIEQQQPQGHWQGEQETAGLESQYILLLAYLGELDSPRASSAARRLLQKQLPDGGWALYPDGKLDLSISVLAYFSLKLTGHEPHQEYMQRAREAITREGGASQVDASTGFFLALLGQISYDACPGATQAALRVIRAHKPVKEIEARKGIRELFLEDPGVNRLDRFIPSWWRRRAGAKAERQVLESSETSASAIIWTIVALKAMGCTDDSPQVRIGRRRLDDLIVEQDDLLRVQPFHRTTQDTPLALRSVLESGLHPEDECVRSAVAWLLDTAPSLEVDDQALAALALSGQFTERSEPCESLPPGLHLLAESDEADDGRPLDLLDRTTVAMGQMESQLLNLQNHNGLEALGSLGRRIGDPAIDRAIARLRHSQLPDGSWGDLAATAQVLTGLAAVGVSVDHPLMTSGANWLLAHQQACGGWGESPEGLEDASRRGQGPVTASQTAWALLGLIAAGLAHDPATLRGVRFLVSEQSEDGTWHEPEFTARSAEGQICRSEYHGICYPLLALSRWAVQEQ